MKRIIQIWYNNILQGGKTNKQGAIIFIVGGAIGIIASIYDIKIISENPEMYWSVITTIGTIFFVGGKK